MKILFLDIETAPNTAYVWGLWDQNIAHDHMVESSYILCWSAKWLSEKKIMFASCQDKTKYTSMINEIYKLLNEADVVVHYYGSKFDIPVLNKEFAKLGMPPPAPYKQIDMKFVVAKAFKFESNKLAYVAESLGFGKKMETKFSLWVDCMTGNVKAWAYMGKYNRHDVILLEKVYHCLRPWITSHPNHGAFKEGLMCPKCGGIKIQSRGTTITTLFKYARYQCQTCLGWFRSNKTISAHGKEKGVNIP